MRLWSFEVSLRTLGHTVRCQVGHHEGNPLCCTHRQSKRKVHVKDCIHIGPTDRGFWFICMPVCLSDYLSISVWSLWSPSIAVSLSVSFSVLYLYCMSLCLSLRLMRNITRRNGLAESQMTDRSLFRHLPPPVCLLRSHRQADGHTEWHRLTHKHTYEQQFIKTNIRTEKRGQFFLFHPCDVRLYK
jgi:hypothetical protein